MLGLVIKTDSLLRPLKQTLSPLESPNLLCSNISKLMPSLLSPLKLTRLSHVLRPLIFILFHLCCFIMLFRPIINHIILHKLGQVFKWALFFNSPQYLMALFKILMLALVTAVMYNPGTTVKFIAFIYTISVVIMRLTLRLLFRAGLLTLKLIVLLVRFAWHICLRRLEYIWHRSNHIRRPWLTGVSSVERTSCVDVWSAHKRFLRSTFWWVRGFTVASASQSKLDTMRRYTRAVNMSAGCLCCRDSKAFLGVRLFCRCLALGHSSRYERIPEGILMARPLMTSILPLRRLSMASSESCKICQQSAKQPTCARPNPQCFTRNYLKGHIVSPTCWNSSVPWSFWEAISWWCRPRRYSAINSACLQWN